MTPPAKRPKRNPNPTWKEKDNLHTEQAQGKKNEPNQNKPKQNKESEKGKDKVLPTAMPTPLQEVNISAIASNVAAAFVPKPVPPIVLAESTPKEVKAVEYDDPQPQTEVPFIPEHASNPPEEATPKVSGTVAANIAAAFVPKPAPAPPIVVAESTPKRAEVAFIPEPTPHEEANVSAEVVSPPKEVRAAHSIADQPPTEDGISAFMPDTATPIPALCPTSSCAEYLNLPNTNPCCISIDVNYGRFYACKYCAPVPVRQERPFTCGHWREHIKTAGHVQKAKLADDAKKVIEKRQG